MRGIIHLGDLHKRPPWLQHELFDTLEMLGLPPGPDSIYSPYPPPELIVLGGTEEDWQRLQPWLSECESLTRPATLEELVPLLVGGEHWRPETFRFAEPTAPETGGDWWALDCRGYPEASPVAAGIRGLELSWEGRGYRLRDGADCSAQAEDGYFARFPDRNLAVNGWRCRFEWIWMGHQRNCAVAENAHDWPIGHAKKLYGYLDNDPVRAELSRDGQLCLSVYEVDALLSPAPFPWRQVLPGLVALIWPPQDPIHSVFYLLNPDFEDEEDRRNGPPALVLGPDSQHRYALALDRPVARRGVDGEHLLGAGISEFGIFDAHHQLLRTRPGQLLGGHASRLVVWQEGKLWAEDFLSGERQLFGYEKGQVEWAFPVLGGSNLLLLRRDETHLFLRLI